VKLRPGNAQHQGAREAQQDSFGFSDLDDRPFVAHAGLLGVVCDGMGGMAHGGAAGVTAVRTLLQAYAAKDPHESIPDALRRALQAANAAVVDVAREAGMPDGVGTTAAVVVVHDGMLHWIAAGDTRIYVWRAGRLTQVNLDHIYGAELDAKAAAGEISRAAAVDDPDRQALTSHLGMERIASIDGSVRPLPLFEGDRVLVCSDGVYRALTLMEMAAPLGGNPQRACETLIARVEAKRLEKQDNMTAIVIGIDGDEVKTAIVDSHAVEPLPPEMPIVSERDRERDRERERGQGRPFDHAASTRAGERDANEDAVDVLHGAESSCWVIADGLGGHRGGAVAAKIVADTVLRSFRERADVTAENVTRHVEQAQDALLAAQRSDSSLASMRSTVVVLVANASAAVWGHVGDSRLYQLRGGRVVTRTKDHSVTQALVDAGHIDEHEQGTHEDRSRLLRSLGNEHEPVHPTIAGPHALCRDDAFLLCTDGFWESLDDVAIEIDYAATEDAAAWLDRLEARLLAQDVPLKDNYTAATIRVLTTGPDAPRHDPRPAGSSSLLAAVRRSSAAGTGLKEARGSLFGAHRATVARVLYVLMALTLIALLYTAYVAYTKYAAARREGREGDVQSQPMEQSPPLKSPQPAGQPSPAGAPGQLGGEPESQQGPPPKPARVEDQPAPAVKSKSP
jgi:PPM family protein phosphatase